MNINFYVIPKFQPQNGRQIFSNASHFMAIDEGQGGGYREVHHRRGGDHLGVPVGLEEVAAGHEEPRPHRLGAGAMGRWDDQPDGFIKGIPWEDGPWFFAI